MMASGAFVLLLLLLLVVVVVQGEDDVSSCAGLVRRVLGRNRPEFMLVPDAVPDPNNFVTSEVEVALDWRHLHDLLRPAPCLAFYLLEYGPRKRAADR